MTVHLVSKRKLISDLIHNIVSSRSKTKLTALCLSAAIPFMSTAAIAQDENVIKESKASKDEQEIEVITVDGYLSVLEASIAAKRYETVIVDTVSTENIGNLPATSLIDVLNTIPGAGITRHKGGGTEVSLRGLGPKLVGTRFNGRASTNGTGNRTVNFGLFPSELVNNIKIYKSQRADLVEGGIAGVIEIGSLRPLEYGDTRFQATIKGSYSPYIDEMDNADAYGSRATVSYVDQFELGDLGDLGFSFGLSHYDRSNPQDRMFGSSSWYACDATETPQPDNRGRYPQCNKETPIDLDGDNKDNPFYLTTSSYGLTQQGETDQRDAIFSAIQWIPSDKVEVNLDLQYSNREYTEDRQTLNFEDMRRVGPNPVYSENGSLMSFSGTSLISSNPRLYYRKEEFKGLGLNVEWNPTDRLTLSSDLSYSKTARSDVDRRMRLRSDSHDIYGNELLIGQEWGDYRGDVPYTYDFNGGDVPTLTVDPRFDVTDHSLFSDDMTIRRESGLKEHVVSAVTLDALYDVDGEWLTQIKAGVRIAKMTYDQVRYRTDYKQNDREIDRAANEKCRTDFPQDNFLEDAEGAAITTWATFDNECLYTEYTGSADIGLPTSESALEKSAVGTIDVSEDTYAAYVMADFSSDIGGFPISGNFGARFVQTKVSSDGVLFGYTAVPWGNEGNIELIRSGVTEDVNFKNTMFDVLPSVNASLVLTENLLLRGAVYKALSRPDPSKQGAGRTMDVRGTDGDDFDGYETVQDAISRVRPVGSPSLEPLRAINYDLSLEWYANEDTLLAGAIYFKQFEGGYIPVVNNEEYVVDGETAVVPVSQNQATDDTSDLKGFELSFSHAFKYLPGPFDGLGVKLGYNYADLDYKLHDIRLGDQIIDGELVEGIIPSTKLSGFSKETASAQLFYKIGSLEIQGIYKYRSPYHLDFLSGNNQIRVIAASEVVDARVSYKLNDNVKVTFEARNLTDEPTIHDMPIPGNQRDYQSYGPTYYLGVTYKNF